MRRQICLALAAAALPLGGCTVVSVAASTVSVAATTVSVGASAVGLAADAAVGTAKLVGKGVGAAADAMSSDPQPDTSGIAIRYRDSAPPASAP